jgi:hypothetical protein
MLQSRGRHRRITQLQNDESTTPPRPRLGQIKTPSPVPVRSISVPFLHNSFSQLPPALSQMDQSQAPKRESLFFKISTILAVIGFSSISKQ